MFSLGVILCIIAFLLLIFLCIVLDCTHYNTIIEIGDYKVFFHLIGTSIFSTNGAKVIHLSYWDMILLLVVLVSCSIFGPMILVLV